MELGPEPRDEWSGRACKRVISLVWGRTTSAQACQAPFQPRPQTQVAHAGAGVSLGGGLRGR